MIARSVVQKIPLIISLQRKKQNCTGVSMITLPHSRHYLRHIQISYLYHFTIFMHNLKEKNYFLFIIL